MDRASTAGPFSDPPNDGSGQLDQPRLLTVFLCHSSGDKEQVRALYRKLTNDGFKPWLDEEDLVPGQEWETVIPQAVGASDVVAVCLSQDSVTKEGYVQKEIAFALGEAGKKPEGAIYIIPVRLEKCLVPNRLSRWQWVDLFEDRGYYRLMQALRARAETVGASIGPLKASQGETARGTREENMIIASGREITTRAIGTQNDVQIQVMHVVGEHPGHFVIQNFGATSVRITHFALVVGRHDELQDLALPIWPDEGESIVIPPNDARQVTLNARQVGGLLPANYRRGFREYALRVRDTAQVQAQSEAQEIPHGGIEGAKAEFGFSSHIARVCPPGTRSSTDHQTAQMRCICTVDSCYGCCIDNRGVSDNGDDPDDECIPNGSGVPLSSQNPAFLGAFVCGVRGEQCAICDYSAFDGCCTARGICHAGDSAQSCGTNGEICEACQSGSVCSADHRCTRASTTASVGQESRAATLPSRRLRLNDRSSRPVGPGHHSTTPTGDEVRWRTARVKEGRRWLTHIVARVAL